MVNETEFAEMRKDTELFINDLDKTLEGIIDELVLLMNKTPDYYDRAELIMRYHYRIAISFMGCKEMMARNDAFKEVAQECAW